MNNRAYLAGFAWTLLIVSFFFAPSPALAEWPAELTVGDRPTLAPLLERVTPAVVNIAVTGSVRVRTNPMLEDPFFRRFFNLPDQPRPFHVRAPAPA